MARIIDSDHPFFRPLWVRVVLCVFLIGWAVFEYFNASIGWALFFCTLGVYATWELLLTWTPPTEEDAD